MPHQTVNTGNTQQNAAGNAQANVPSVDVTDVANVINVTNPVVKESIPSKANNVAPAQTTQSVSQPSSNQVATNITEPVRTDRAAQAQTASSIGSTTNAPVVNASEMNPSVSSGNREAATQSGYEPTTASGSQSTPIGDMIYPMSYGAPIHYQTSIAAEKDKFVEEQERIKNDEVSNTAAKLSDENGNVPIQTDVSTGAPVNVEPQPPIMAPEPPSSRHSKAAKKTKKETRMKVSQKKFRGLGVYGKIMGDPRLRANQVGIGVDVVRELLRVPNTKFPQWVIDNTGVEIDMESPTLVEDLIKAVNNSNAKVATWKPPVNRGPSAQKRTLRIVEGRGIFLHPIMAKQYNADFDGDDMTVSFKESALRTCKDPMAYLFDVDGYPSLEEDFFPKAVSQGQLAEKSDMKNVVKTAIERNRYGLKSADKITEAVVSYYSGEENGFESMLKAIVDSSREFGSEEYEAMSSILSTVYSTMRQVSLVQAELGSSYRADYANWMAMGENNADVAILDVVDGMVSGVAPLNFQDIKTMLCEYYGEVDEKNIAFRCSANIAKMFKFDDRTIIGEEGLNMAVEHMISFAMSKRISNSMYRASKAQESAELLRDIVLRDVGLPRQGEPFNVFMRRFVDSYQENSAIINMANHQFLSDMSMTVDGNNGVKPIKGGTVSDMVAPFLDIYGDLKLSSVFGQYMRFQDDPSGKDRLTYVDHGVQCAAEKFESETIRRFSKMSKVALTKKDRMHYGSLGLDSEYLDRGMLFGIASSRTSTASKFNIEIYGKTGGEDGVEHGDPMAAKMHEVLQELSQMDSIDNRYAEDLVDLLNYASPDAFAFYEMDNLKGFLDSKYGNALMSAKSADEVGGIRMAMIAEMRMTRVIEEQNKLSDLEKDGAPRYMLMRAENDVQSEMAELASSSFLWRAFGIDEVTSSSAFEDLAKMEDRSRVTQLYAPEYWKSPRHESMKDVMLDTSMGKDEKQAVLADLTRWYERFDYINSYEMGYQLELDSGPMWSSLPPTSSSVFDVVRDFDGRYNGYKRKTREALETQVNDAYRAWSDTEGALETTLKALSRPGALVDVSNDIYADALTAVLDRVYAQSEKAGGHPAVNVLYQALMYQRYGEFDHDVYRTDDKVLGIMASNRISIHEVVRILSDRNESITVYDEFGQPVAITRDILCGVENSKESHVWDLLKREPSIAMAIRGHIVNAKPNTDGKKARLSALYSMESTISYYQKRTEPDYRKEAKAILRDHPGYGAIIALSVPTKNRISRSIRNDYKAAENNILNIVCDIAVRKNALKPGQTFRMDEYLKDRGVTEQALLATGAYDFDAKNCYALMSGMLDRYSDEIKSMDKIPTGKIENIYFDEESISAFFDVRQELNGAKISMSTEIEGTETFHFALWMSLLNPVDKYTMEYMVDEADLEQFNGLATNLGEEFQLDAVDDLIDKAGGELVVEVPDGYTVKDKSTDQYGQQVPSVLSYLIIKRDNGAEQFNLKVKKYGDDGKDSITKYDRLNESTDFFELQDEIENMDPMLAKRYVAGLLRDANEELGYEDMDEANYINIANLMILETEDGLKLRSIEMIARAIKNRMPRDLIEAANINDLSAMAKEIEQTVGIEQSAVDPVQIFSDVAIAPSVRSGSLSLKPRASGFDRRRELLSRMSRICRPKGEKYLQDRTKILEGKFPIAAATAKAIAPRLHLIGMIGYEGMQYDNIGDGNLWMLDRSDDKDHKFDPATIKEQLDKAYQLGITVGIRDDLLNLIPATYRKDVIPFPGAADMHMLPMFDMKLNGAQSFPPNGKFGIYRAPRSSVVSSYEDSINEFSLGDAMGQMFRSLVNRVKVKWTGSQQVQGHQLFSNVVAAFPDASLTFGFADRATVKRLVVDRSENFTVDYGVTESSPDFSDQKARIDAAIERFADNFGQANEMGWILDGQPGDIAGFAVVRINDGGNPQYCLAPLIPFPATGSSSVPTRYHIDGLFMGSAQSGDAPMYTFNWRYSDSIEGQYFKVHEGAGAANKMMFAESQAVDGFVLANGITIDMCYAQESTASRRAGTNRKIRSMESLMFAARCDDRGYNFAADSEDSFPGMDDFKIELAESRVSRERWGELLSDGIRFHNNPDVDRFVRDQVTRFYNNGGNPSDFLANRFGDSFTDVFWDFAALFGTSRKYEDDLLKFMNTMRPDLVPFGLEGDDSNTMFKVNRGEGFDYGCLQVLIPHRSPTNPDKVFFTNETLFMGWSFFGEEFSGFHKPNVNGASGQLDMLMTMALMGKTPNQENLKIMLEDATRDIASVRTRAIISREENVPSSDSEE